MTALPDDELKAPAPPGAGVPLEAHLGALLLVHVYAIETNINTTFGLKDAVRCDIDVIDGPGNGESYHDALIFPKVLLGQLRGSVGGKVIGRLSLGTAKAGQKPPWKLDEPTADEFAKARAWLALPPADDAPPF